MNTPLLLVVFEVRARNRERNIGYKLDLMKKLFQHDERAGAQLTMMVPNTSAALTKC